MLDVTKKVWQMLLEQKTNEEILEICSVSSLKKIRAVFNKQKSAGALMKEPVRFPQKPRGKKFRAENSDAIPIVGTPKDWIKQSSAGAKRILGIRGPVKKVQESPPDNYPKPGKPDIKVTDNFEKGEQSFDIKSYEIHTLEGLIEWTGIDTKIYECASFTANRWGNEKWECTQCKALFKPRTRQPMSPEEIASIFNDIIKGHAPARTSRYTSPFSSDLVAIMPIADFHFGSYALKNEIGHENNLVISRENILNSTQFHLDTMHNKHIGTIAIPVLGDFYNTDTPHSTTTAGTFQDETSSWKDTSRKGVEVMIEVIELCRTTKLCKVKVIICNGNHDLMRSFAMGLVLEAFYKDNDDVEIDNSHTTRKYDVYGNSIFGYGHGDTKANADYLGIMCEESPELFAQAKHRTMLIGHLHHKTVEEKPGIIIRRVGSLTSSDAWHRTKGYQSVRSSESFVVDKKDGIISNSTFYLK